MLIYLTLYDNSLHIKVHCIVLRINISTVHKSINNYSTIMVDKGGGNVIILLSVI